MKILVVEAVLYHADGQTDRQAIMEADMTELIVSFHNFANTPNNTWRWPVARLSAFILTSNRQYSTKKTYGILQTFFLT
jgi:hypothetical protein